MYFNSLLDFSIEFQVASLVADLGIGSNGGILVGYMGMCALYPPL